MNQLVGLVALLVLTGCAAAVKHSAAPLGQYGKKTDYGTTICAVEGDGMLLPSVISWNTSTRRASAEFRPDGQASGQVTLIRKHGEDGDKVNLVFPSTDPGIGDEFEIIVFPSWRGQYRAIGVANVVRDGRKHLSVYLGSESARCTTLQEREMQEQ